MYLKVISTSVLFVIIAIYFNPNIIQTFYKLLYNSKGKPHSKLFSSAELNLYNGIDKPQLYLAIMGKVFDVTKGSTHYGPGKTYNFFVGRDGSRSFITGDFDEIKNSDHIADLSAEELRSLDYWVGFYKKEYTYVGKLIGRYYQEDGKLTPYGKEMKKLIKLAEKAQEDKDRDKLKYPPCNVEWDAKKGSRVWCTKKSGGIERDWAGVPRQLYEPGSEEHRCACIEPGHENMANLKVYEGCDSESDSCYIKN